jgi:preprotein translocase subunit SecG
VKLMTTLTILNVIYVLIAIAMIGFILVQRGAGAQAGSGFGAGASATVFGSRGAGNFLSKTTKYLASLFFLVSLGMGIYATRGGLAPATPGEDLGVMGGATTTATTPAPAVGDVPAPAVTATPAGDVPAPAPEAAAAAPASDVPASAPAASPSPAAAATPDTKQ